MNVTRAKLSYRILSLILVPLMHALFIGGVIAILRDDMAPRSPWGGVALCGGCFGTMALLSWWMLYESFVRYEWDEYRIIRRALLGETEMTWANVQRFRISRMAGGFVYFLYDLEGRRLRADIQMVGEKSPLHVALQQHLAGLMERQERELNDESSLSFSQRPLGIPLGRTITLEPDRLTLRTLFSNRTVSYADVRCVYQTANYQHGHKVRECQSLSDGERTFIWFDSHYRDYDRLVHLLRKRMPHAVWLDMTSAEVPADPRAAWFYHRKAAALARTHCWALGVSLVVFMALIGFCLFGITARGIPHRRLLVPLVVFGLSLFLYLRIWAAALSKRRRSLDALERLDRPC